MKPPDAQGALIARRILLDEFKIAESLAGHQ